jgi:hypothetical protein
MVSSTDIEDSRFNSCEGDELRGRTASQIELFESIPIHPPSPISHPGGWVSVIVRYPPPFDQLFQLISPKVPYRVNSESLEHDSLSEEFEQIHVLLASIPVKSSEFGFRVLDG